MANRKPTNPYFDPNAQNGRSVQSGASAPRQSSPARPAAAKRKPPKKKSTGTFIAVLLICAVIFGALYYLLNNLGKDKPDDSSSSDGQSSVVSGSEVSSGIDESSSASANTPVIDKTQWNLILVNASNAMQELNTEVVTITGGKQFDARAAGALEEMLAAANETGLNMFVCSAYRSVSYQTTLYNNKVQEYLNRGYSQADAERVAATIVAYPGTSEHNTGLAADIVSVNYQVLDEGFAETPEFAWLQEHAHEYGFILRFPKGKEDVTGIIYEPWHYRYVGVEHATEIRAQGICLEEYLA